MSVKTNYILQNSYLLECLVSDLADQLSVSDC